MAHNFKDYVWKLRADASGNTSWEAVHAAILMDIRDELKRMNSILHCSNFLDIPHILRRVSRNTAKPKRKKKAVKV